ncbi:MAG: nitrate reductase cytochrome c-type subunit [Candidatus Electrothrix sp. YB6]
MKKFFFILSFPVVFCSFSLAAGEEVKSLRGDTALPADSNPAVEMDWKPADAAVARTFVHQPPVIPHSIEGFSITTANNNCLGCHGVEGSGAPRPFKSHYLDRDGQAAETISSRWYFCTQCHVGQVKAKPLVENTFQRETGIK